MLFPFVPRLLPRSRSSAGGYQVGDNPHIIRQLPVFGCASVRGFEIVNPFLSLRVTGEQVDNVALSTEYVIEVGDSCDGPPRLRQLRLPSGGYESN